MDTTANADNISFSIFINGGGVEYSDSEWLNNRDIQIEIGEPGPFPEEMDFNYYAEDSDPFLTLLGYEWPSFAILGIPVENDF